MTPLRPYLWFPRIAAWMARELGKTYRMSETLACPSFGGGGARPALCTACFSATRLRPDLLGKHDDNDLDFRGDLQTEVMNAVWKLGEATVEDVLAQQPKRRRSAYTTVQTTLNRLFERGLLTRHRKGRAFVYEAKFEESEFLTRTIGERLATASRDARRTALLNLVDELAPNEVDELARRANQIKRAREKG